LACATTIGADCACDGVVASCMAVRAAVASSANRKVIMLAWILMEIPGWESVLAKSFGDISQTASINE
jgi:hypothetical protein